MIPTAAMLIPAMAVWVGRTVYIAESPRSERQVPIAVGRITRTGVGMEGELRENIKTSTLTGGRFY
jgi:hypothetical protein